MTQKTVVLMDKMQPVPFIGADDTLTVGPVARYKPALVPPIPSTQTTNTVETVRPGCVQQWQMRREPMRQIRTRFRFVAKILLPYFAIGVVYGMIGEMRIATKYSGNPMRAWQDPYAYARSMAISPIWPYDLFWTVYHCSNPFGCARKT